MYIHTYIHTYILKIRKLYREGNLLFSHKTCNVHKSNEKSYSAKKNQKNNMKDFTFQIHVSLFSNCL